MANSIRSVCAGRGGKNETATFGLLVSCGLEMEDSGGRFGVGRGYIEASFLVERGSELTS
jgi:hypothetical protein